MASTGECSFSTAARRACSVTTRSFKACRTKTRSICDVLSGLSSPYSHSLSWVVLHSLTNSSYQLFTSRRLSYPLRCGGGFKRRIVLFYCVGYLFDGSETGLQAVNDGLCVIQADLSAS